MSEPPYVVGIGASAGGLEALQHFFDNVPADTTMALVVVQHLSPDFKSLMDELLGRHTRLPIHLVEDGMQVEPGHVYLIPPKKEMIISGGRLLLSERDRAQELSLPIDVFFRSLGQDCETRAIAVVLSGSGSDGSRGVCDVHEAGGLVIVQDVDSAQFDGMPRTARETGAADWVLDPQHMPHVIEQHIARGGKPPVVVPPPGSAQAEAFADVYRMLERDFGLDFTHYKPSTITRRIERRLRLARTEDIEQYVTRLRGDRNELDVLYRDLLIGVTRFFRNDEAFAVLQGQVFPELLDEVTHDKPLRVWVAGCATGEEAYSIAMLLHELTADRPDRPFKIFATDVHRGSLELASRAFYSEDALRNLSPARRERYFARVGGGYQLVPELRQSIVFAQHNVIKDAPFTRVDLISCRNMLIYLQPTVQQKVLAQFHFALDRGGIMFLGPSESPGALAKDFAVVDRAWRIYRKYSDVRIPIDPRLQPRSRQPRPPAAPLATGSAHLVAAYDALLDEVMPPSLLINERWELVHAFAGASKFLKPRDGRPSSDVASQVGDELARVFVGGLRRALLSDHAIVFRHVRALPGDDDTQFHVSLRRIVPKSPSAPHVLVSFEPVDAAQTREPLTQTEIGLDDMRREQVGDLQTELAYTKENLQAAIEQLEMGNEELQASNEELMSSNEELQSTNEELQSVNEELYTVNAEYQSKIAELTELTNDMDNLLASTDIGTIFLDGKLRIRKFTPQVADAFNLLPQDVGRSIESFTTTLDVPDLASLLRRVVDTGERIEREVCDRTGHPLFMRILPYRAKGGTAGAVVTFVDVTSLKAAEDALFHERFLLDSLLASTPDAIYFRDTNGRFIRVNPPAAQRLQLDDPGRALGKLPSELPAGEIAVEIHRADDEVLQTGLAKHYEVESRRRSDGEVDWYVATRMPMLDEGQHVIGMIGVARDVSAQKRAEQDIQQAIRRRDEFLAMLSHELRNPLAAVVSAIELLKSDGDAIGRPRLVDILDRQTQQMARLLDDLLDASRVTHNKIELRRQRIELREIVEEAIAAARPAIAARRHELAIEIERCALPVDGDPARLQQVYVNLLTNATKYTPERGHISVRVSREQGQAVVRVRDDGMGIAPGMLDAVFELFVQSYRTLDRAQGGIGVGLTLARALVELHDGTIEAASEGEGKGATFVVRLPLALGEPPHEVAKRTKPRGAGGRRVLVVEDNEDARDLMCHMLARAGWECRAAADGLAALALVDGFRPHAAIIDVGLPGIDGFEVARRIRRDPQHTHATLVAVTGYGQPKDRSAAMEAGFDTHIVKPVKLDELLRLIEDSEFSSSDRSPPVGEISPS